MAAQQHGPADQARSPSPQRRGVGTATARQLDVDQAQPASDRRQRQSVAVGHQHAGLIGRLAWLDRGAVDDQPTLGRLHEAPGPGLVGPDPPLQLEGGAARIEAAVLAA